jgi:AcrR family transcriptional regulator
MLVRKDTAVRQKEIALAARKLIVKYGSEHVTVQRMAKEIGVTESAIYRHFKSKRDILSFLADDIENTLIEDIETSYSGTLDSLDTLRVIIAEHISSIEQRKGVTFQVIAEIISLGDKKLNKTIYDAINRYIARIKDILAVGVQSGIIRNDINLEATAKLFFGFTQGLVNRWALSQYSFNLEEEFQMMWEVFLKGVAQPTGVDSK